MDEWNEKRDPREVVDWYVPRQGREVVDYYVHHDPLPDCVRPAPVQPQRKKRLGLWIFLGIMGLLAVVLILFALLGGKEPDRYGAGQRSLRRWGRQQYRGHFLRPTHHHPPVHRL